MLFIWVVHRSHESLYLIAVTVLNFLDKMIFGIFILINPLQNNQICLFDKIYMQRTARRNFLHAFKAIIFL